MSEQKQSVATSSVKLFQCSECNFGTNIKTSLQFHELKYHWSADGPSVKGEVERLYYMVDKVEAGIAPNCNRWKECSKKIGKAVDLSIDVIESFLLDEEIRLKINEIDINIEPMLSEDTVAVREQSTSLEASNGAKDNKKMNDKTMAEMDRLLKECQEKCDKTVSEMNQTLKEVEQEYEKELSDHRKNISILQAKLNEAEREIAFTERDHKRKEQRERDAKHLLRKNRRSGRESCMDRCFHLAWEALSNINRDDSTDLIKVFSTMIYYLEKAIGYMFTLNANRPVFWCSVNDNDSLYCNQILINSYGPETPEDYWRLVVYLVHRCSKLREEMKGDLKTSDEMYWNDLLALVMYTEMSWIIEARTVEPPNWKGEEEISICDEQGSDSIENRENESAETEVVSSDYDEWSNIEKEAIDEDSS